MILYAITACGILMEVIKFLLIWILLVVLLVLVLGCVISVLPHASAWWRNLKWQHIPLHNSEQVTVKTIYNQGYLPHELCRLIYEYCIPRLGSRLRSLPNPPPPPPPCHWQQNINGSISLYTNHKEKTPVYCLGGDIAQSNLKSQTLNRMMLPLGIGSQRWGVYNTFNAQYNSQLNSVILNITLWTLPGNVENTARCAIRLKLPHQPAFTLYQQNTEYVACELVGTQIFLFEDNAPRQYFWKFPDGFHRYLQETVESYGIEHKGEWPFTPDLPPYQSEMTGVVESGQYLLGNPLHSNLEEIGELIHQLMHPHHCGAHDALDEDNNPLIVSVDNMFVRLDLEWMILTTLVFFTMNGKEQCDVQRRKLDISCNDDKLLCNKRSKMYLSRSPNKTMTGLYTLWLHVYNFDRRDRQYFVID